MKKFLLVCLVGLLMTGCASTKDGLSPNMTNAVSRSAGDIAMTALLDEGVNSEKALQYVTALSELFENGDLDKNSLEEAALALATKYELRLVADYIDTLIGVIPSSIGGMEKIPEPYRSAVLSFLKDGAVRALELYKPVTPE